MKLVGKAAILTAVFATSTTVMLSASAVEFTTVPDIAYVDGQVGDLYLPENASASTPMVLTIHGGAWTSLDRASWSGVAEFFAGELGFAAFNIEYRLAGAGARWPACGDDCVAAARYILSSEFKSQYGFNYDKIWICGGSAGGHLALWTLVNLDSDEVAGCIAISPIGDPSLDYAANPSRYTPLFDGTLDLDAMNPCLRVASGMAPVLITHATGDTVVPIASSKAFAAAYRAAGNTACFFEYPNNLESNTGGHCIWRSPESSPKRLINSIESEIAYFAGTAATMDGWIGRSMTITSVSRHPIGTVQSVDLAFGADNGSVNRLYVAYGDSDGGTSIKDWQDFAYLGEVTGETNSWHAAVPTSRFCRFFMVDSSMGTPLKWVTSNGSAYLDTGLTLKGGDAISLRFRPEKEQQMCVLGTRKDVNTGDIAVAFSNDRKVVLDYCNGDYATYRLTTSTVPTNNWYDIVLSASKRSVHDASGTLIGADTDLCDSVFETEYNCWLFSTSGNPASGSKNLTGSIASFEIVRDGDSIASYKPFRRGGTCGFFDLATGNFIAAASGTFSGVEDDVAFSPFATATDALAKGPGTEIMQPREVSVVSVIRSGGETQVQLAFGSDNGCANRLYVAYGGSKGGDRLQDWENVQYLGVVNGATDSLKVSLPVSAQFCRFFLFLPFEGDDVPVPLQYVTGNGSGYFDTGFKLQGGDAITAGICPKGGRVMQVLGTRKTVDTNDVEVVFASDRLILDYCSGSAGSYDTFRLVTSEKSVSLNTWYDIVLSASERSVHDASGALIKENTVLCDHVFETEENCWLFAVSGSTSTVNKFDGNVAEFTLKRGDRFLASYSPCRVGERYGFYDLANGVFVTPATGTFTGVEDTSGSSPLAFVTKSVKLFSGFAILFR